MEAHILNINLPATLETKRLTMRGPQSGDGPAFRAAVVESLQGLQRWLGIYQDGPPTIEQMEAFVREHQAQFLLRQNLVLLSFLKGTETIVACTNLRPNWKVPSFEIGYWCRHSYQGEGYVTEAVIGLTDFAFSHLNAKRIFIQCDIDNDASANVARRAGFEFEGTLRNDDRKPDGTLSSTLVFSQIRPD